MPLIALLRLLLAAVWLALLASGGYMLWSWQQGELVTDVDGVARLVRQDWWLWAGLTLVALPIVGPRLVLPLLARKDIDPSKQRRSGGHHITGASGASLYLEGHGPAAGPVIILTHGWGLDSTIWFYAVRALSSRYRVLVWDLPGLGRSTLGSEPLTLETLAADLGSVIATVGGTPVVLVGHSIGGMTIQTLARDRLPALASVKGIVLINTTFTNPLKTMICSGLVQFLRRPVLEPAMRIAAWLQPLVWLGAWQGYLSGSAHLANRIGFGRFVTRSQLEHTTLLTTRNPPGVLGKGNLAMFRWDATGALAGLGLPVLVMGGDLDIVTKLEASRMIEAMVEDSQLDVVSGVNHMGFLERADIYNAAIERFAEQAFSGSNARS